MSVSKRNTTIEGEECLIHLPARPNGYAILILGDRNHFVKESSSLWLQHPSRNDFIDGLLHAGYTVFYCDLGIAHWGNDQAFRLVERLVNYVLRNEILNKKIHLFAEGMGTLLAIRLIHHPFIHVRSLVLFNPCLDLLAHMDEEKKNRFFYKRFVKEITEAYGIDEGSIEEVCQKRKQEMDTLPATKPIRVFQVIYQAPYSPDNQIRPFLNSRKEKEQTLIATYFLPGKTIDQFIDPIIAFYKNNEKKNIRMLKTED
ncbi:hypothetical protein J2S74_002804 [Evansella vedderi]|uniref:Alpha/beta hydrolase n=1 Tax=Evansella vedderi TaxID=38282 RepID=A0ABT9ZW13_9BACI|nr:alpha/beta hydrolase [Evansella vedderi]MDQ0255422.1 hypothetical protein [Evansella vedderi]